MNENIYEFSETSAPEPDLPHRRLWVGPVVLLLALSGVMWIANGFYQRSVLFERASVAFDEPALPWGLLVGDDRARKWFGAPTYLHILQDDITTSQARLIGGFTSLESLEIRDIDDAEFRELGRLTNLRHLRLLNSPISDDACQIIGQFEKLRNLEINCHTSEPVKITDAGLAHLSNLKGLVVLELQVPSVTDAGLKHLADLPALDDLWLREAQIRGDGLKNLENLNSLKMLVLKNCSLEGDCLRHLAGCKQLSTLSLPDSSVSDEMLDDLTIVPTLRILTLNGTDVSLMGCNRFHQARPDVLITDANGDRVGEPAHGTPGKLISGDTSFGGGQLDSSTDTPTGNVQKYQP